VPDGTTIEAPPNKGPTRRSRKAAAREPESGVWYPRWFWPSFAAPGIAWLLVLFILPFYAILSVAFGTVDIFRNPLPIWQPWYWTTQYLTGVLAKIFGANAFLRPTYERTLWYVVAASAICLVVAYAVAYYVSRYAGRRKTLILILLVSPFWISYLMRMLAWVNLLESDGYVNRILQVLHLIPHPYPWLEGRSITVILGLVYGYIPYMILPFYGFLDRIEVSLLEAGRDLGASPASTFWRVTLPLSKPAIYAGLVIISLPMFGDYYTNNLLSNSPKTTMIGNLIDDSVGSFGQGPEGAVLVVLLMVLLLVPMIYYLRSTMRAQEPA
jgi:ABC-type spermidine/putrescine transport system permease subunit I